MTLTENKNLQNKLGIFQHNSMDGTLFGEKVWDTKKQKYVYLLPPTPELWTRTLETRTQILFRPDISFVISYLDVRPGVTVIESGTGSASLTISLSRAVAPTGHVFTYEFNQVRADHAQEILVQNRLDKWVTAEWRDVISNGFLNTAMPVPADAIFLDLPNPWEAVKHANAAIKIGGRICSFSPCIEQVQRTVETLKSNGFSEVETYETQSHTMVSKRVQVPTLSKTAIESVCLYGAQGVTRGHTGYLTFAIKTS